MPERTAAQKEALRIHRRFFTALALHDLVHEVPIVYVAWRYGASKGLLQTLQSAAGTFAGMVTVFCNRLGWKNLELLLSQFQSRLMFGVERELCELVQISLLNGFRARVLYNSGFHTLASLATANPIAVETCLRNAVPFKSNKLVAQGHQEGMDDGGMGKASTWCAKLRRGMTEEEAARVIVQEAQEMLARQLNVPTTVWGKVDIPVVRGGAKNEEAPPNGEQSIQAQSGTNQPSRKTSNKAESTVDHVTASANKIAGLRGHRVSPNAGESDREIGAKRPRLQSQASDTSPAISCEARTADSTAKSSTSKPQPSADQSNSVAQQQVTKPNSEGPGSLLRPDFTKASSLLLSVNKESTPAQPRAKTKRQSAADESAIILSPIPSFNIDSETAPVTTITTAE
ncbi:MAG: hypothetical protein MJE68_28595, partial [Proteobacteria bacterium]|nr:hypothetical protein [Pseudomonadota bacterium]